MPHRNALGFLLLFFVANSAPAEDTVLATMPEIEAMASQQRWAEALLRLDDILPGQRDDRWQGLVVRVVVGHLSQLSSSLSVGLDGVAIELGRRYPFLGRSEDYRRRRDDALLSGYRDCVQLAAKERDCPLRLADRLAEVGDDTDTLVRAVGEIAQLEGDAKAHAFVRAKLARGLAGLRERLEKSPNLRRYVPGETGSVPTKP